VIGVLQFHMFDCSIRHCGLSLSFKPTVWGTKDMVTRLVFLSRRAYYESR